MEFFLKYVSDVMNLEIKTNCNIDQKPLSIKLIESHIQLSRTLVWNNNYTCPSNQHTTFWLK